MGGRVLFHGGPPGSPLHSRARAGVDWRPARGPGRPLCTRDRVFSISSSPMSLSHPPHAACLLVSCKSTMSYFSVCAAILALLCTIGVPREKGERGIHEHFASLRLGIAWLILGHLPWDGHGAFILHEVCAETGSVICGLHARAERSRDSFGSTPAFQLCLGDGNSAIRIISQRIGARSLPGSGCFSLESPARAPPVPVACFEV